MHIRSELCYHDNCYHDNSYDDDCYHDNRYHDSHYNDDDDIHLARMIAGRDVVARICRGDKVQCQPIA